MTSDRSFERSARAWLELGPTDPPDHVVADVLRAIETMPQQRVFRLPWTRRRTTISRRLALAAVFGVIVATGGSMLLLRVPTNEGPGGTTPPSATAQTSPVTTRSPATAQTSLPRARLAGWVAVSGGSGIWLQQADGSERHELAPGIPGKTSFDISPDGGTIVFTTGCATFTGPCPGSRLWEANTDGEGRPVLTWTGCPAPGEPMADTCDEADPAFSPDGMNVAFIRSEHAADDPDPASRTIVVTILPWYKGSVTEIESTRVPRSTDVDAWPSRPVWSPDGKQIAYLQFMRDWSVPPAGVETMDRSRIEVVNVDGTHLHELPVPGDVGANAGAPSWAPNDLIVFSTAVSWFGSPQAAGGAVFTMRSDGSGATSICEVGGCIGGRGALPTWLPGRHLLFWSDGTWAVMDSNGANAAGLDVASPLKFDMNGPTQGTVIRWGYSQ